MQIKVQFDTTSKETLAGMQNKKSVTLWNWQKFFKIPRVVINMAVWEDGLKILSTIGERNCGFV